MSRDLRPVPRRSAAGLAREVYEAIARDFVVVPPLTLHSPAPELMAGAWSIFRETMLCGAAPRPWKEAVAAAVARANRCPFCVDAHTMFLHGLGAHGTARRLAGPDGPAPDGAGEHELDTVVAWASAIRTPAAPALRKPPFGPERAPELVGAAVGFQYVTALVTVFLGPTPIPRGFRWMKGTVRRAGGTLLARRLRRRLEPGRSLALLPEAPLPEDLGWAAGSPAVAGAFARFAAAAERAGERALSEPARAAVAERIAGWRGEPPPLGRGWLEPVPSPAGRLALLAALAPERIGADDRAAAAAGGGGDRALLETVAWGAFAAARRVGSWMRGPY